MKFILRKASDNAFREEIELKTIEDLMKIFDKHGSLILHENCDDNAEFLIYDDYQE